MIKSNDEQIETRILKIKNRPQYKQKNCIIKIIAAAPGHLFTYD